MLSIASGRCGDGGHMASARGWNEARYASKALDETPSTLATGLPGMVLVRSLMMVLEVSIAIPEAPPRRGCKKAPMTWSSASELLASGCSGLSTSTRSVHGIMRTWAQLLHSRIQTMGW